MIFTTQFKGQRLHWQANELKVLLWYQHICILFHLGGFLIFMCNSCYHALSIVSLGTLFPCLKKSKWKKNLWHLIFPLRRHIYIENLMFQYYKIDYLNSLLLNKSFHTSYLQFLLQALENLPHESHLRIRFPKKSLSI